MRRLPHARPIAPESSTGRVLPADSAGPIPDDYLQIRDYVRIVYKRRWIIMALLLAGLFLGLYQNSRTPTFYQARATLLVEADPNVLGVDRPVVPHMPWLREFLPTQLGILESGEVARMAREDLEAAAQLKRSGSAESAESHEGTTESERDAELPTVAEIMGGRSVSVVKDTRLVTVAFRSHDPALAADVANALSRAYVRQTIRFRNTTTDHASSWLAQQLAEQRKIVEAAEAALQRYRETHGADALFMDGPSGDRQNIIVQKLAELQAAVTRARAEVIDKESQYLQLTGNRDNYRLLETLPLIASSSSIQKWKGDIALLQQQLVQAAEQLGERHPEMIKLRGALQNAEQSLQTEIGKLIDATRVELEAARSREGGLARALEQQKREVQTLNAKAVDYAALEREAKSNREILDKLLQRVREATLAGQLESSPVRIVESARVPWAPVPVRTERNIIVALVGSGALALGLIFILEIFNTRLTSPDDIKRHLEIEVLGVTPRVRPQKGESPLLLSPGGAPPQFAELLHAARTNIIMAAGLTDARTLLVTSSEPGEGKSVAAANLAVSLARLNQRVLLIDADLRKPKLHEMFGVDQQPGLTDVLAGRATHGALRKTKMPRLWLMPSGVAARNPADVLGSARFSTLVECFREQFDWIVLDSPPVLAVTDPCLIARAASSVLFVVGCNQTSREVARAAVDRLDAVGANVVGALLNRADLDNGGESYLPYYHRDYQYYPAQEASSWVPRLPDAPAKADTTTGTA